MHHKKSPLMRAFFMMRGASIKNTDVIEFIQLIWWIFYLVIGFLNPIV